MDEDLVSLKVAVGRMTERLEYLSKAVEEQEKTITELVALANQGRGSIWLLISAGGVVGFIAGNIKWLAAAFRG